MINNRFFYIGLGHIPVKVSSAVVGAMNSVFIAVDGVAVDKQFKKMKLCKQ